MREDDDMPRPPRKSFEGAKYHIAVRGNGRQDIFLSDEDRRRFLDQLKEAAEKDEVRVYAYVLMSNHYHLLIETRRANVSAFMQRLNTAYGMYFRYKHKRPGHVLQGRYKGKLVEGDDYLLRLTRYVHLNPVKIKSVMEKPEKERLAYLRAYEWSSYGVYVGPDGKEGIVDVRWRELARGRSGQEEKSRYRRYVEGFIARDDEELKEVLNRSVHAVGDEEFVERVERELRNAKPKAGVRHDVAWPADQGMALKSVDEAVCQTFGCRADLLRQHGKRAGVVKSVAIEAACRLSGLSQRAVGNHYGGISGAAVTKQRRRLVEECSKNRVVTGQLEAVLEVARSV